MLDATNRPAPSLVRDFRAWAAARGHHLSDAEAAAALAEARRRQAGAAQGASRGAVRRLPEQVVPAARPGHRPGVTLHGPRVTEV